VSGQLPPRHGSPREAGDYWRMIERAGARAAWYLVANCSRFRTMPVDLSIKNVPDAIAQRLRQRAARHHRSLQDELLAIIEEAAQSEPALSPTALLAEIRRLGVRTPSEAAAIVRTDRERR
jgi:antitoxin FitA